MQHVYFVLLSFALIALTASACTSSSTSPTAPSSIAGSTALNADAMASTWRLQSIQKAGQPEQPAPARADYTLAFTDRLSVRADCNTCSSSYTVSGSTITVGNTMACTRAACPTMAFENEYTGLLTGEHTVTTTPTSMVWMSSRGTIRFVR